MNSKMSIGLISINMYSRGLNFACPLHTYAFQQFLLQHGIESTILDYKPARYKDFDIQKPYNTYRKQKQKLLAQITGGGED